MNIYTLPNRTLPYELYETSVSRPTYDMHGDRLTNGGNEVGIFRRFTPNGKPKWARCLMSQAVLYQEDLK